jgi:hypothetical protein
MRLAPITFASSALAVFGALSACEGAFTPPVPVAFFARPKHDAGVSAGVEPRAQNGGLGLLSPVSTCAR